MQMSQHSQQCAFVVLQQGVMKGLIGAAQLRNMLSEWGAPDAQLESDQV